MFCCDVDDKFNHKQQQLYDERLRVESVSLSPSLVVSWCHRVDLQFFRVDMQFFEAD